MLLSRKYETDLCYSVIFHSKLFMFREYIEFEYLGDLPDLLWHFGKNREYSKGIWRNFSENYLSFFNLLLDLIYFELFEILLNISRAYYYWNKILD